MQLTYKKLFTDENEVEYCVVKTDSTQCLCLQGKSQLLPRIKKAFLSAKTFYPQASDSFFEPLSVNTTTTDGIVNALFTNVEASFVKTFLQMAPLEWQYATGKKLGRILKDLHSVPLTDTQKKKASERHSKFMEHLATYVADLPHFKNDKFAMDAISMRYDHFKIFRPVMRYGSLKHQKVMIRKDSSLILLPSYSFGPGDLCEDLASLECESAGIYPVLCAGVIDGYFSGKVPTKFWLHFALYCALYSLWKCGLKAKKDSKELIKMQQNSDRIREDFANYTKPVPNWYSSDKLQKIKERCIKLGL